MAITSVKRLWSGRVGGFAVDGGRKYGAVYRVLTDSITDSELAVALADGVPKLGDTYVTSDGTPDPYALCLSVDPRQDDSNGFMWMVECSYSTEGANFDPGQGGYYPGQGGQADDPTLEPPEWEFDWESMMKPFRRQLNKPDSDNPTWDGPPVVNYAWDYYNPLPEYETGHPVLVYSRNEASFDMAKARKYAFAMNKDEWLGLPPKHAQCLPIKAKSFYKGTQRFFRVTYRFKIALISSGSPAPQPEDAPPPHRPWVAVEPDTGATFNPVLANVGFRELVSGKWKNIEIPPGQPASDPQFLGIDGRMMSYADLSNPEKGPIYVEYSAYRMVNFAPLNITL